jgi:glycosyltransferase involved in cell wall biosynthesis
MRIGIEAQRIFRSKKHGMDIVALNTIKALQELDKVNEYFIFTNNQEDTTCLSETSNFKIIRTPGYLYPIWEQILLPRMVSKYKIDVLHCTSNTAPININVPLVITLHDIIYLENNPLQLKGTLYQKWGNFYRSHIVPLVIKNACKIITVSNFEKKRISDFLEISESNLDAVYNGVSDHFFKKANIVQINSIKIKYKLPSEYIFLLGNTDPKKNISRTLKAYELYRMQSSNPLPLVIADYSEESLMKEVHENGLKNETLNFIYLVGYVQNTDLPVMYQLCSLFLYTSIRESFGIPILEAMASGVPVITSKISALPEIAGHAAMLIDPYNEQDMADKVTLVLSNEIFSDQLIIRGLQRVQQFRWEKTGETILNIYNSLTNKMNKYVLPTLPMKLKSRIGWNFLG